MNLLLRVLKTLLLGFFGRRIGVLEPSTIRFRVWPNDLDVNMHMNNGRYLTVMDLGRLDLMVRTGLARTALQRRWMPVLGGATIRFRRSLGPFQRFRLHSRLLGWDDKWLFIEQGFETDDGEAAAQALVKAAIVRGGRTVPTAELLAALGVDRASPPLPAYVVDWLAADASLRAGGRADAA